MTLWPEFFLSSRPWLTSEYHTVNPVAFKDYCEIYTFEPGTVDACISPGCGGGGGFFINDNEKHIRHFTQPQPCTAKTFFIEEDVAICMFVRVHCSCMPFSLYELKFETILFSMDFTRTGHSPQLLRQNDIKF